MFPTSVRSVSTVLTMAFLLPVAGCEKKTEPSLDVERSPGGTMTAAEAENVARRIETAINEGNAGEFHRLLSTETILRTATDGLGLSEADFRQLHTGARATGGFYEQIRPLIQQGGSYKFLRVRRLQGEYRALFRLLPPEDGGVNYHDFILAKRGGVVRVDDVYVFMTGETFSKTMRRILIPLAAQKNRGILERLAGGEEEMVKHIGELQQMTVSVKSGQHARALEIYRRLPDSLKQHKLVMLFRLQAASHTGTQEFLDAFRNYEQLFPGDPSLDLVSLNAFFYRREFDKLLAAIDHLDKALGGDPFLDLIRANVFLEKREWDQAAPWAERAVKAEPDLEDAHWSRLEAVIQQGHHAEALEFLKEMDRRFTLEWSDFHTIPGYAPFVQSPQHQHWMAYLRNKSRPEKQP